MSKRYFVDVLPIGVKAEKSLTYQSEESISTGQIVKIPHGRASIYGIVTATVPEPDFATKPIEETIDLPPLPPRTITLAEWIAHYYGASLGDALKLFIPPRPAVRSRLKDRDIVPVVANSFSLNQAQLAAIEAITAQDSARTWLLHGATGSGKTAVYIELCKAQLKQGKSALVLVPEITLATQVIAEFEKSLGARVIATHSKMTEAQRRALWQHALTTDEPLVMIGPRSALFSPLKDIGTIIIDECHETSYKQEQSPYYHARDVAAKLASITGASLVLGSATPSTHDIFLHRQGRLELLEMPDAIHQNSRSVEIIDMKKHHDIISPRLKELLASTLAEKQQSLLFINRRGSASQVLCAECGEVQTCGHCHIPRTWHADSGLLRCHWCGSTAKLPVRCTSCDASSWRFLGIGTKRIEAEITKHFPHARILRLDKDSFSARTIEASLKALREGEVDILIGTQMIAKGLDLPGVKLVGVVLADTLLHIPDIYSSERTYQLLHQVIGRSGRSDNQDSHAVIQTYMPTHPAITHATQHEFHAFMDKELNERNAFGYPPYRYILKLVCKRKTERGARTAATKLGTHIRATHPDVEVKGPAPAWREQLGGSWYWNLVVTARDRKSLRHIMSELPANWRGELDPIDLL